MRERCEITGCLQTRQFELQHPSLPGGKLFVCEDCGGTLLDMANRLGVSVNVLVIATTDCREHLVR